MLQLGSAERVDAIVEMKNPGVWILGTPMDEDRNHGMGIVVKYAGRKGKPQWHPPGKSDWNYLLFGESKSAIAPDAHGFCREAVRSEAIHEALNRVLARAIGRLQRNTAIGQGDPCLNNFERHPAHHLTRDVMGFHGEFPMPLSGKCQ